MSFTLQFNLELFVFVIHKTKVFTWKIKTNQLIHLYYIFYVIIKLVYYNTMAVNDFQKTMKQIYDNIKNPNNIKVCQKYFHVFHTFTSKLISCTITIFCPVSWGSRIHQLHLCRGVRPSPNECLGYDTKQSDGKVPVMLGLWGMRRTPHCHCSQVHSGSEQYLLIGPYLRVK